jgi:hypothetical protein
MPACCVARIGSDQRAGPPIEVAMESAHNARPALTRNNANKGVIPPM